jgi:hypothetical protein
MKPFISILTRIYALILLLYPSNFRDEFGEEMRDIFFSRVDEAAFGGFIPLVRWLWLETYTFPGGLMAASHNPRPLTVLLLLVLGLIQAGIFSFFIVFAFGAGNLVKYYVVISLLIGILLVFGLVWISWKTGPELKLLAGVIILAGLVYPTHALMGISLGYSITLQHLP